MKIMISKQISQVYVKTFPLVFVCLKPKCRNLKRTGAPEVKDISKFLTHNFKLKVPNYIQVFISPKNLTKQVQTENSVNSQPPVD